MSTHTPITDLFIDRIARQTRTQFKRDKTTGSKTICRHCNHKIEAKPSKGITARRVNHLKNCEKLNHAPYGVEQLKDDTDEGEIENPEDQLYNKQLLEPDENDLHVKVDDDVLEEINEYRDEDFPYPNDINPEDANDGCMLFVLLICLVMVVILITGYFIFWMDVDFEEFTKDVILLVGEHFGVWNKIGFEIYRTVFDYARNMVRNKTKV